MRDLSSELAYKLPGTFAGWDGQATSSAGKSGIFKQNHEAQGRTLSVTTWPIPIMTRHGAVGACMGLRGTYRFLSGLSEVRQPRS